MDLSLLQTFTSVARLGSFAAVARSEGVDPSSVSRRIAALEQELQIQLFERTTRRLALTEAGRLYLDRITEITDALTEAADIARDAVSAPSGLLRVTSSVAFAERWLIPRLGAFRAAYPLVEIEMILSDAQIDIAREGIDVALRLGPGVTGSLIVSKLFDVRYRAVASPDYLKRMGRPDTPAALADHDGLLFALPRFGRAWRFRSKPDALPEQVHPRTAITTANALALRRAALEGLGVALLADWTIAEDLQSGALVDLFPDHEGSATDFDSAVWTVYASRTHMPARVRAFLDHLRRSARSP